MNRFDGQVAIVTGSSKGIGRATALQLARGGAAVTINARHGAALEPVAEELRAFAADVLVLPGNVTRPGEAEALVEATLRHFGRLDLVVNTVAVNTTVARCSRWTTMRSRRRWFATHGRPSLWLKRRWPAG